jgi:hypothetical protein
MAPLPKLPVHHRAWLGFATALPDSPFANSKASSGALFYFHALVFRSHPTGWPFKFANVSCAVTKEQKTALLDLVIAKWTLRSLWHVH